MPGSMYDRLGDMLHDVLESGAIPADDRTSAQAAHNPADDTRAGGSDSHAAEPHGQTAEEPAFRSTHGEKEASYRHDAHNAENRQRRGEQYARTTRRKKRRVSIAPLMPAQARNALAFLGLTETATREDAKKAYHEKLKYYHPDRHGDNPVLQKVAREKTQRVIEAWETLERFFS